MTWTDAWWFTLWTAIFSLLVASWVQAQEAEGGIFSSSFETGDTCEWDGPTCEEEPPPPQPVHQGPCDDGEHIAKLTAPYSCESYETPQGLRWRALFGVVCSNGDVRVGLHEYGSEKPRNCEESSQ